MLATPASTDYDLRFRLLGIPTRVHPLFWLVAVMLGGLGQAGGLQLVTWVGCVFVSILVHEYGHGLTARALGYRSSVVLYALGGLCSSEGRQSPGERLLVLVMGPGAGFLLFATAVAAAFVAWGVTLPEALAMVRLGPADLARSGAGRLLAGGEAAYYVFYYLFYINFFWGALNLLPVWPLDGGQIAAVLFGRSGAAGARRAGWLSLATAGALAAAAVIGGRWFIALLFAYLATLNYQLLRAPSAGRPV